MIINEFQDPQKQWTTTPREIYKLNQTFPIIRLCNFNRISAQKIKEWETGRNAYDLFASDLTSPTCKCSSCLRSFLTCLPCRRLCRCRKESRKVWTSGDKSMTFIHSRSVKRAKSILSDNSQLRMSCTRCHIPAKRLFSKCPPLCH